MNYKNSFMALAIIGVFFLSVTGAAHTQAALVPNQQIEENFSLLLMTNAGNRIRESYAFFIKQSLAPLGINVEILAKPFGQFVGDLLHYSSGQPFDLAIIGFSGGGPTPSFMWKFHSQDTSFGKSMYQLDNPTWQANMISDIGISTAEVDALLESIDFELNPLVRLENLNKFADMYMNKLLYDIPLTTPIGRTAVWKGFGGDENQKFSIDEGFWYSSFLGASWSVNLPDRAKNANDKTYQVRVANPSGKDNFDPYQSFDTSTSAQTTYSTQSLLMYDKNFAPHPGVAMQWTLEDYIDNGTLVPQGKHTFIVNENFQFAATTDYQGNAVPAHNVTADDFKLALDMLKQGTRRGANINGLEQYNPITNYEVSTTFKTNDTLQVWFAPGGVTPDDYVTVGGLSPIPSYLLGGDLHYNATHTVNIAHDDGTSLNFQKTEEWKHWTSKAGNTEVGPMALDEYDISGGFWSFQARNDYVFPNEWDIMDAYAKDPTGFDNLMASMNTTGWYNTANLGTFAPHAQDATKGANAYYFAYDSQGGHEKPTTQNLQTVVCKIIPDTNAALVAFEAGQLDAFGSSALGANTVKSHEDDPRFNVFDSFGISGPVLLVFNLLNENLMKRDVRYSIASMLDKTEMTKINDGFSVPTWSPVWLVYDRFAPPQFKGAGPGGTDLSWYTPFEVPYSFETAKNLMRGEGYTVPDEFNYDTTGNKAPIDVVATTLLDVVSNAGSLGSNLYIGLSAFAITSVVLLRRRRDY